ncbi:MAG TPA: chorismate-binding protein, partial [Pirellulales bacterium]
MIQQSGEDLQSVDSPSLHDWPGVAVKLDFAIEPRDAFLRLCHLPYCLFFDSAVNDPALGRYSFMAVDPFDTLIAAAEDRSIWDKLAAISKRFTASTIPELPPFQGGIAGLFSYELSRTLERLPRPRIDEFQVPGLAVGLYDVVVAFDHLNEKAWIISQGFPEQGAGPRHDRARYRAEAIRKLLAASESKRSKISRRPGPTTGEQIEVNSVPVDRLQSKVLAGTGVLSNFSRDEYLAMVQRGIDYVYAGDVFQVNLAQRLLYPAGDDAVSLYLRLRERNPAPFAAYFDLGDFQIVSASPE